MRRRHPTKFGGTCLRVTPRTSKSFLTEETLNTIEESRKARLDVRTGQYRKLKREILTCMRRIEQAQFHGVCKVEVSHLWLTGSPPAYRGIPTLRSTMPPPHCSTMKAPDGTTLTGDSEICAGWTGYFKHGVGSGGTRNSFMYTPNRVVPVDAAAVQNADPNKM